MSVARWILTDGATSWTMPINPKEMSTPYPTKQRQTMTGTTATGVVFFRTLQTPVVPFEWTFGGVIRTEDHYDQLLAWSQLNRVITVTDHYGRVWSVLITEFTPEDRQPSLRTPWRLKYTMRTLMFGRVT